MSLMSHTKLSSLFLFFYCVLSLDSLPMALQMGAIGKPFQKMRRRLTVTGSSGSAENVDGRSDSKDFDDEQAQQLELQQQEQRRARKSTSSSSKPSSRCC